MNKAGIRQFIPKLFAAWLIALVCILILAARIWMNGLPLQADLLAMLPEGEQDRVVQQAVHHIDTQIGTRSLVLVGAENLEQSMDSAAVVAKQMQDSGAFSEVILTHSTQGLFTNALEFRYALSDTSILNELTTIGLTDWLSQQSAQIYGPLGSQRLALIHKDPLYLAGRLLESQTSPGIEFDPSTGTILLRGENKIWVLIEAKNASKAFGQTGPLEVQQALQQASQLATANNAELISASAALHTAKASTTAKSEINRIGIGSWLGSMLLLWLAFRSVSAVVMCLLPLAVGVISAIVATVYGTGSIHVMTLVFGASLIGVAIDYGTHCFADSLEADSDWTLKQAVKKLRPALFYGMFTSVIGYLALAVAPFPGLREIAIFSSTGLLTAYLTVIAAFPVIAPHFKPNTKGKRLSKWVYQIRAYAPNRKYLWLLVLPICLGLWQLKASDDLHSFYTADPSLTHAEQRIKTLFPQTPDNQFFLVEGNNETQILQREQNLLNLLKKEISAGTLNSARGISQKLPPQTVQQNTIQQWQTELNKTEYSTWLSELGISPEDQIYDQQMRERAQLVSIDQWLASPLGQSDKILWLGKTERGYASIVMLSGIKDTATLSQLKSDGVRWVDRVDNLSKLMASYRNIAILLTSLSFILMMLFLTPRFGFNGAVQIVIPSMLSALGALALFGLLGIHLNIFAAFAMLLVIALGVDYAIFFRESGNHDRSAMLGVMLDSSTTLLSFGLLAMSSLPAARSFGLMLLFGITLAFLFAPMAQKNTILNKSKE